MSKDKNDYKRKKGSDKKKKTFELYGKNTSKGLRIKQQTIENQKNKNIKD
jgi:hypothetical protein